MAATNLPHVSYELDPKVPKAEQVIISCDGVEIERCSLAERQARRAALGYAFPKPVNVKRGAVNGYGWTKSGRRAA
jgi:hypothetical protein